MYCKARWLQYLLLAVKLKSVRRIDFSCTFSVGLMSFNHEDSAVLRFFLLLLKLLSMILKFAVLTSV